MSCQTFHDAIVDLARGLQEGRGTAAEAAAHTEHCGACAARLRREQQLTEALRTLARSSADARPSDDLEARLTAAFVAAHAGVPALERPARVSVVRWLATAAAAVLLASVVAGVWALRHAPDPRSQGQVTPSTAGPVASQPVASRESPASNAGGESPRVNTAAKAQTQRPSRAQAPLTTPSRGADTAARLTDFVPLPGAAGLPDFESGRIVRVELPLASLPAYGVDMVPDAARSEIEADLLVGQDGQPRAIRIVTQEQSRSR